MLMNQSCAYAASYGDGCAEFYDEIYGSLSPRVIATLCDLTDGGSVLELGIGTGRVALRLAERGVNICGVEASSAMISRLRDKPGGAVIPVIQGNFATIELTGTFSLIFTLVNTFLLLRSRSEQRQCLNNVSRLLSQSGVFLVETFKPVGASRMVKTEEDGSAHNVHIIETVIGTSAGSRRYRSELCYMEPWELDHIALDAGLRLKARWRNWQRQPWTENDLTHISLYERIPAISC